MQPGSSATSNGSKTWRSWKDAPNRPGRTVQILLRRGHFLTRQFSLEMLLLMFPLKRIYGKTLACFQMRNLTVVLQTLFRSSKLCMSHPSSLASLSHSYFESLGRNIEEQADCQTRIEICWFWRGHKSEIKTETTWGFNPDGVAAVLQPPRNHTVSQT